MKSLRVLFLTRKWPPAIGGMETYSRELVRDLAQIVNIKVRALPGRRDGNPPSLPDLAYFMLSSIFFLFYHRKSYDVVHLGDLLLYPLAWWHALWAPRTAIIITVYGLDLIYGNRNGFKPTLYRLFISWAKKHHKVIDYFIANSRSTRELCINEGFIPVKDIPLGVRLETTEDFILQDFRIDERYILFVGRLVRRKGVRWFAENVLPGLYDNIKFYVVGKTWDQEESLALKDIPRVKLLGYLTGKQFNYIRHKASAIVMPNIRSNDLTDIEGFGIAALEAAACGVPLVASNIEGLTDAVRHRETGFLVRAEDVKEWQNQLKQIFKWDATKRIAFGKSARKALKQHFNWSRVAQDTVQIYNRSLLKKVKNENSN